MSGPSAEGVPIYPITEDERRGAEIRAALRRCLADMTTIPPLQRTVLAAELWERIAPLIDARPGALPEEDES